MDKRSKRIWRWLVNYVNASSISHAEGKEFQRIVTDCMPWVAVNDPLGLFAITRVASPEGVTGWVWAEAARYQHSFQMLFRWLCSAPKSEERNSLEKAALGFLLEHTGHIGANRLTQVEYISEPKRDEQGDYDPDELEHYEESKRYWTLDGKARDDSPLGTYSPGKEYEDFADPICDFICEEYQKFRKGQYKNRHSNKSFFVPIFVCPSCSKFVMPERIGKKKFCSECSDKARAERYRRKAPPDENRDYQFLYRLRLALKGSTPAYRTMRLKNPTVRKRISDIKKRESPRCKSLIDEMKL